MAHPLSKELHEVRFGKRSKPGLYGGYPEWEQRAADALDAYHKAEVLGEDALAAAVPEGLEIVKCKDCAGTGLIAVGPPQDAGDMPEGTYGCGLCLSTGKRLQKKEA